MTLDQNDRLKSQNCRTQKRLTLKLVLTPVSLVISSCFSFAPEPEKKQTVVETIKNEDHAILLEKKKGSRVA